MFVKDYMTRHPIMVDAETTIIEAQSIIAENNIRHLPVVGDGKRLQGLITRQRMRIPPTELASLNVWEITRYLSNLRVKDVMVKKKDVITISENATLEDAAKSMITNKIGSLLVLEKDVVMGIITDVDMMVQLTDLLGGNQTGVRVTIRMPNKKGELAKLMQAISEQGWGIFASGGLQTRKDPDHWDCVVKVRNVSRDDLVSVLEQIEGQEIIDVR
mgnify:CR=1 FL=1|jgi:acetoin utilization protein AcuB